MALSCFLTVALAKAQIGLFNGLGAGILPYGAGLTTNGADIAGAELTSFGANGLPTRAALSLYGTGLTPFGSANPATGQLGLNGGINPYAAMLGQYRLGQGGVSPNVAAQYGLGQLGVNPYAAMLGQYGLGQGGVNPNVAAQYGLGQLGVNPYAAMLDQYGQYGGVNPFVAAQYGLGQLGVNPYAAALSGEIGSPPLAPALSPPGRIPPVIPYANQPIAPASPVAPVPVAVPVVQARIAPAPAVVEVKPTPSVQFGYGVQTADANGGAEFGHTEEKSPLGTIGSYHVNTPGSYQYVNYKVPNAAAHVAVPVEALG